MTEAASAPTETTGLPDLKSMPMDDLLKFYNKYSDKPRLGKWPSVALAAAACTRAYAKAVEAGTSDKPTREPAPKARGKKIAEAAPDKKGNGKAKPEKVVEAKPAKVARSKPAAGTRKPPRSRESLIVMRTDTNPRREGSISHGFFANMMKTAALKTPTVQKYLDKYPGDEKNAGQWLWNSVRDGFVELVPPKG